jgi:hypothetical protein
MQIGIECGKLLGCRLFGDVDIRPESLDRTILPLRRSAASRLSSDTDIGEEIVTRLLALGSRLLGFRLSASGCRL